MTTALLIVVGIVIGVILDRCYAQASAADRLDALKGRPPRRYNESGARFDWWEGL